MAEDSKLIEMLRTEMRTGFQMLADGIGQTNARLDQTNARLEQSISEQKAFRNEVSTKLDGISSFLLRSEEHAHSMNDRLERVERRVDKLERRSKPA
jgi:hypothetical protein